MSTALHYATPVRRRERAAAAVEPWPAIPEPASRRLLNVLIALLGIFLTAPLLLVIALLVGTTSRGPVVFVQHRVGIDRRHGSRPGSEDDDDAGGRPFEMYKFRTMYVRPDGVDPQVWATPGDSRVTPVGRVLRGTRLDELPQLFNVLKGDMNVVGPRPEQPAIFKRLRREISSYQVRQRARPGITGLAQVTLTYDRDLEDVRRKVALDLDYLQRQSVGEDLRIMAKTLPVMLGRRAGW